MKLCAILIVWDDWELMEHSYKHLTRVHNGKQMVDGVIVIASETSNYGEKSPIPDHWKDEVFRYQWFADDDLHFYQHEPQLSHPMNSETEKRNFGLQKARELGFTHFIILDSDEYYNPVEFEREKQRFIDNPDLAGLVCATQVFFKSPCLTIGLDTTRVPFIHKITPGLHHSFNRKYPFAWEGPQIRIDPTRSLNIDSGVEWSDIVMFHMSWVRKDYAKKIRNSTARSNIERSTIKEDLFLAKEGYKVKFYGDKVLHRVPNYFNIPEYDVMV